MIIWLYHFLDEIGWDFVRAGEKCGLAAYKLLRLHETIKENYGS